MKDLARGSRPHAGRTAGPFRRCLQACGVLAAILSGAAGPASAQQPPANCESILTGADFVGPSADLARAADLLSDRSTRSFMIRRLSDRFETNSCATPTAVGDLIRSLAVPALSERGARLLPVDSRFGYHSSYPRDWNDGVLWGGAGIGVSVTGGAVARWGILEAALAPVIGLQQNSSFATLAHPDTATYSRYVHRWHGRYIDLPQRFGNRPAVIADLGRSYLRVNTGGFRGGISSENLAWGPARRNPLMLSGTAAGFPHIFLESARPHDVWLGDGEIQMFWGRLSESDYFDKDPANDHRGLAGTVVTLRPRGLDGLYVGAAYLHMQNWQDGTSFSDLLIGPYSGLGPDSSGLPQELRMLGLFMRWASAPDGFEVYGEWARQDAWQQWFRLTTRLDAPQAFSVGLQKIVRRGTNAVRLSAEISHLSDPLADRNLGRGIHTYYVSPHVRQGHTHRGQLLGAPIGPGSEAQFLGADVFWSQGRSSFSIERVRYDEDAFYAVWGQNQAPHGLDTELSFRGGHLLALPSFSVEAELGYSFRYSRSLLGLHHVNAPGFPYRRDANYQLRLSGRWHPPLMSWEPR